MEQQEQEKELNNEELLLLRHREALSKGLKVFVFEEEDLKSLFSLKKDNIAVALLAKNEDNAIYNLKNQHKCYVMEDYNREDFKKAENTIIEFNNWLEEQTR